MRMLVAFVLFATVFVPAAVASQKDGIDWKEFIPCLEGILKKGGRRCEACADGLGACVDSCIEPEDPICWGCIIEKGISCALCGHTLKEDWGKCKCFCEGSCPNPN